MSRTTKVRPAAKPAANDSPMPPKKPASRAKRAFAGAPRAGKRSAQKEPTPSATAPAMPAANGRERGFPIVGIGASAGGLEALDQLFAHMPNDTGMAFVVITHQHPGHTSLLPELLGKITSLTVRQAADGLKAEPNHVYVSPPGGHLAILGGTLHRMKTEKKDAPHLPIDYFFRSLAVDQKDKAICIVLSGTGTDGTLGLKVVKGESGMAMVQQVQSAKYAGMPSSAVATGLADYVLPAAEMPKLLVVYARGPDLAAAHFEEAPAALPEPMQKIFVLLRSRTGHDFSSDKSNTILRRIERRMNLHQIKGPAHYVRYLQDNPHEIDFLFKELLISVTNFFRDPEAFEALEKSALPALLKSRPDDYTFRVWVPGCATGEDVYSLAILMREYLETAKRHCDAQIFGTDLDNDAIEAARIGQYPDGISSDVPPPRLERYFVRDDSTYRIRKDIREMAVFAVQNLIRDPPFTKLDLISCRNLLIYLNTELQHRLVPLFHYALKPGGLLFLGSLRDHRRLRRSVRGGGQDMEDFPAQGGRARGASADGVSGATRDRGAGSARARGDSAGAGIEHRRPRGPAAARAFRSRQRGRQRARRRGLYSRPHRHVSRTRRRPAPAQHSRHGARGAAARPGRRAAAGGRAGHGGDPRRRARQEQRRLQLREPQRHQDSRTGERARAVAGDLPAAPSRRESGQDEGPRAQQARGEPRRGTRSRITEHPGIAANDDRGTGNRQRGDGNLQGGDAVAQRRADHGQRRDALKVEDLSRTNDDMQNLLNSTEVATLFLDNELNIKRYTEQARQLINLIQTDIGRPLAHLASSLAYEKLVDDCREVLRTLVFKLAEVPSKDGRWYLMRIMPYRTAENVIDGVVITFVDISPVKAAEKSLLRMSKVFLNGPEPMMILDLSGRITDLNDEAERACGWSRQEMLGQPFQTIMPKARKETANGALERCLAGEIVRDVECGSVTKAGRELPGKFTLKLLTDDRGQPDAICMIAKHPVA